MIVFMLCNLQKDYDWRGTVYRLEVYFSLVIHKEMKSVPALVNVESWRLEITVLKKYCHPEVLMSSIFTWKSFKIV